MKDMIYRQAAIDVICKHCGVTKPQSCDTIIYHSNWCPEVYALQNLPSVQPEIVRCRDCKWSYDDAGGRICSYGVCVDCVISDDFYCADAERRTDE